MGLRTSGSANPEDHLRTDYARWFYHNRGKKAPDGMMNAPWVYEIDENDLTEGDLIFVDIPGTDELTGAVIRDANKNPVYGVWNHVMTTINPTESGQDIITTEGRGGDFRINPNSQTNTRYWFLSSFKDASGRVFENTTRYRYMRINWEWLYDKKSKNQ
jgi:hypothetical protein